MKLTTLKPRVGTMGTGRARLLEAKPDVEQRPRGRAWMQTRTRIAIAQGFKCFDCDRSWLPSRDQVDHDTPLEQGGSNDDANLRLRCDECHKAKTAAEAAHRAARGDRRL